MNLCWSIALIILIHLILVLPVLSVSPIEFKGEWGYNQRIWTLQFACTVDLSQDYNPNTPETGFYIRISLEPQATQDINVYYPFDKQAIDFYDKGNEKIFVIPTKDNVWVNRGTKSYEMQVKFINEVQTSYGNWPNGTCSGPFALGNMTAATEPPPPTETPALPTQAPTEAPEEGPTEKPTTADSPPKTTAKPETEEDPDDDDGEGAGQCRPDCHPPECSCPRYSFPMEKREIPQMVYFGFDDAVNVIMAGYYDQIFTPERKNPNGCTMKFTLYICDEYTDYGRVKGFYQKGNEIAVHSVTHSAIDNDEILRQEAKQQKENLVRKAGVPSEEIVGWRSPFLKTAGDNQPQILHELGYEYDISLTYVKSSLTADKPWPFTIENGWPYSCGVRPCPYGAREPGFWEVPVVSMMDHQKKYPCSFVDGCAIRANNAQEAFRYLWDNFESYYNSTRTPFGLNMHAAWFYTQHNLEGMKKFLDELQKLDDVYVITVKQVLDWLKQPAPLSEISRMTSWGCPGAIWPDQVRAKTPSNNDHKQPAPTTASIERPTTTVQKILTTPKQIRPITWRPPTVVRRPWWSTFADNKRLASSNTKQEIMPTTTTRLETTSTTTSSTSSTTTTSTSTPTTTTTTKSTTTSTATTTTPTTTTTTSTIEKPTTTSITTTTSPTTTTTTTSTTTTTTPSTTTASTTTPITTTKVTTTTTVRPTKPIPTTTTNETVKSQFLNNEESIDVHARNSATTIAPWFKAWFNSPTTIIPPFVRSGWWSLWGAPLEKGTPLSSCKQGLNCKLPDCFCQGQTIPDDLAVDETPQMIVITIDGSVNPSVYRRYREIFRQRRNPNGCSAKGTVFATASGSYRYFIQRVRSLGAEIAMRGLNEHHFETAKQLEGEIVEQKKSLRLSGITDIYGWKTPEFKSLGDDQFKILEKHKFLYDSTLAMNLPQGSSQNVWPFTLDFGYDGECVIPVCPRGSFPGMWEIPNNALRDYRGLFECTYADGCMFNPPTANDTTNFLMKNLMFNYKTNKAPFGIHLRQTWFSHPAYESNIVGLKNFLDEVQKLKDVYLVSASDVIEWIKHPISTKEITDFKPWSCSRGK